MRSSKHALSAEAAEQMISASIGAGTCIKEVVTWVFGKRRTREALANPECDPEFVAFVMTIDTLVNNAWAQRGIARHLGPYVNDRRLTNTTTNE